MLLWFPTPYPGESLYSLIARYHERSGNYLVCDSIEQLFGNKRQASSTLIPYHLGYLAQQTEMFGLNFETLLHEYTLYDYFLLFSSVKNRSMVEDILRTNSGQAYDSMLGIYGRQNNPKYLRFCPQCMSEERKKYGEAYWHNLHQAPGMLCCEKHRCLLVDSMVPMATHATRRYVTLETIALFPVIKEDEEITRRGCEISLDIAYLWNHRQCIRSQWERLEESFADCYLALAMKKEWATRGGSVRRQRLLDAVENRYGQQLLDILDASVAGNKPWPITMCRHGKRIQSPVKNVLMAELLCGDVSAFLEFIEELKETPVPPKAYSYSQVKDLEQLLPYRERWESLLAENPQASRNELIQSAQSVHLWLSRHDADWLNSHYPPPRKRGGNVTPCDWKQRDKEYLRQVRGLSKRWRTEQGKPCRITKARFLRELGIVATLSEHLPQTMQLIASSTENDQEWDLRRMKWAMQELEKEQESLRIWKVIRKAGICDSRRKECETFLKCSGWLGNRDVMQEVSGGEL